MLDQEAATSHLLHSVQTATVPGCTTPEAIGVAAENLSAAGMEPKDLPDTKPAKTFIPFGI